MSSIDNPRAKLIGNFLLWKVLLLAIAIASPGAGYDTSTILLAPSEPGFIGKLVRWDAIYYTKIAQRNYLFEQDWAFGWGYTRLLRLVAFCKVLAP